VRAERVRDALVVDQDLGHLPEQLLVVRLRNLRVRDELLQVRVEQPALRDLQVEHLLTGRRFREAEAGQHPQERERVAAGPALRQAQTGPDGEGRGGLQDTVAELVAQALRALGGREQRVHDRLDTLPVAREIGLVPLEPQRDGRSDLRGGRRGPRAVQPDQRRAAEDRPRDVRGVGAQRGPHHAVRAEVPLHRRESVVGLTVGHHPAGGDHAAVAGRVDDVAGRETTDVVAGGADDAHTGSVGAFHLLTPAARRQPTHAHRDHVAADVDGVAQGFRERAGAEQHDAVSDAQRDDLGLGDAAERFGGVGRGGRAGQDPDGPGSVPRVVESEHLVVGILRAALVAVAADEVPFEPRRDVFRGGVVGGVVAGVEMGDAGARSREAHLRPGSPELRVVVVEVPGEAVRTNRPALRALLSPLLRALRADLEHPLRVFVDVRREDVVDEVRLDEQDVRARDAELIGDAIMGEVPRRRCPLRQLGQEPVGLGPELERSRRPLVQRSKADRGLCGTQRCGRS
jgi:hypothetical protein